MIIALKTVRILAMRSVPWPGSLCGARVAGAGRSASLGGRCVLTFGRPAAGGCRGPGADCGGVFVPWWQCRLSCGCVHGVACAVIGGSAPFVVCVGTLVFAGHWLAWGGARFGFGGWVLGLGGACCVCWFWLWDGLSGSDVDGVLLNLLTLLLLFWFLLLKKFFFSFLLWGGLIALIVAFHLFG